MARAMQLERKTPNERSLLLSRARALVVGRKAALRQCRLGATRIRIPRDVVASLARSDVPLDASGANTGALRSEILEFEGNDTFFSWLLGRLHLDTEDATELSFGSLSFDTTHSRARAKLRHLGGSFGLYVVSIRQAGDGPIVKAQSLDGLSTTSLEIQHVRAVLPKDLRAHAALEHVASPQGRALLATWLLRYASLAFDVKNGRLRIRKDKHILAGMLAHPPTAPWQPRSTSVELPHVDGSDDEDEKELNVRRRRDSAMRRLRTIATEWPAMLFEDRRSQAARPLLAATMSFVNALHDTVDERIDTEKQLESVVQRLLTAGVLNAERQLDELKDEVSHLVPHLPLSMFEFAETWHAMRPARRARQEKRRKLHLEHLRIRDEMRALKT